MKLEIKKLGDINNNEFNHLTPEERLNIVEVLRLESGKFLYEYPTKFRRVVKVIRNT